MEPHDHTEQARYFLGIVDHPLVVANRQHQSEVLWGAATQMVKAVAKAHNMPNRSHRALLSAVRRIGNDIAQEPDLIVDFGYIEELHVNFYDGELSDTEIQGRSAITFRFVIKMQRILDAS